MYIDIPAKVIPGAVSASAGAGAWPYDDGSPYWSGGATPSDYRWIIDIDVTEQTHSSTTTRKPKAFNGMDVNVGDYVANISTGVALKIINVIEKSDTHLKCMVEDTLRYNTFRNTTGNGKGIFSIPAFVIIFEVNEDGLPVIDPIPSSGVSSVFFANLTSRFQNLEADVNFTLEKENHGFFDGQVISVDPETNTFVATDSDHPQMVGTVSYTGLGPNMFMINPIQKVLDNNDYLPGNVGDILYADSANAGNLTTTPGPTPVMMKIRDFTKSTVTGSVAGGTTSSGNKFSVNGVELTLSGGSSLDFINAVNTETSSHGVTASSVVAPTVIESSLSMAYGEPAIYAPSAGPNATATINGVSVTFTTFATGFSQYGIELAVEEDMAVDINAANIPNIVASTSDGKLVITETSGGSITIVNGTLDTNGTSFAGTGSASGLPLSTGASTNTYVHLEADDARAINLVDVTGTTLSDLGLFSSENGIKAASLYIEQGIRQATTYVVANIASRDALDVMLGDQAYVLDKGDDEWGVYLYNGSEWVMIASEETAKVDSDTYFVDLTISSDEVGTLGEVGNGSRINFVTVSVDEVFNDDNATITVGDDDDMERLMNADENDLSVIGEYTTTPTHTYDAGTDVYLKYSFNPGSSTSGKVRITISYN